MDDEIFKVKALALLHDPPWKPWSISNSIEGGDKNKGRALDDDFLNKVNDFLKEKIKYYEEGNERHEQEALTFARILGLEDQLIKKYFNNVIKKSDIFSASLDRYALSLSKESQKEQFPKKQSKKYNIFNINHLMPLKSDIEKNCIQNYVEFMLYVLNNSKNKLSWDLKYNALYALLEVVWYHFCNDYYPLADTRVNTYSVFDHLYATASMVNWYIDGDLTGYLVKIDLPSIQEVIARGRKAWDFWGGSYLLSWLSYETIKPLIWKFGVDIVLSPFMGLNPFFIYDLFNRAKENNNIFRKKIMVENKEEDLYWEFNELMFNPTQPIMPATVLLALPKRAGKDKEEVKDLIKKNYKEAWDYIVNNIVNKIAENTNESKISSENSSNLKNLLDNPITPARIKVIDIGEALSKSELSSENLNIFKFMYLLELANEDETPTKVSYGVTAAQLAYSLSIKKYENKEFNHHCSSCGILPAVIDNDKDLEEGERLCQYCYLKRKIRKYINKEIYKIHIIPSTIDIANIYNWRKIFNNKEEVNKLTNEIPKDEESKGIEQESKGIELPESLRLTPDCKPISDKESYAKYAKLFYYYTTEKRLMLDKLNDRSLNGEEIYYAIVRGDGDNVGKKLLKGIIKAKSFKDYVKEVFNLTIDDETINEINGKIRDLTNAKPDNNEIQIPVTPDYLITLSRSLMVVALNDALTVSKDGFLIYAGGDDIAFLAPISKMAAFDLVMRTRSNYWGLNMKSDEDYKELYNAESHGLIGFIKLRNMIFDAPAAYGRSYGVYITHYRDPFFYSWEIAGKLEEMKENSKEKDITVIFGGRGKFDKSETAILNNSELYDVKHLYNEIKIKRELSKSFIKDLLRDELVEKCSKEIDCDELLAKIFNYYIGRNWMNNEENNNDNTQTVNYEKLSKINIKNYLNAVKAVDYFDDMFTNVR